MKITMGSILDKLSQDIFELDLSDEFSLKCFTRESTLKKNIKTAFDYLQEHINKPEMEGEPNHWQKAKIERNIINLVKYIEILFFKLEKAQIIDYCANQKSVSRIRLEDDEMLFLVNSYFGTIILDILWASDISVSDVINISKGKVDKESLASKLPDKIKLIQREIIPYFEAHNDFSEFINPIKESISSYQNKIYQGASLLILIVIEGVVRRLGKDLIIKQGLDDIFLVQEFNSLDLFLRKIPWKKDIKIEKNRLMFITGEYEFKESTENILKEEYMFTDLKTRLDFLRRTFKKDRDITLHGDFKYIGEIWDLYRNYSALYEVYLILKYYKELE